MLRSVRGDEASLAQSLETLRLLENALSQRQILLIFYQSVVEGTHTQRGIITPEYKPEELSVRTCLISPERRTKNDP